MYRLLFKLVLTRIEPERAHALAKQSLKLARATAAGRAALSRWAGKTDPCLQTRTLGLTFDTPVGVAAGVDKDGGWFEDLAALGFGFVEIGTITATGQDGNPRPRTARAVNDRAILNRMGFPNPGAELTASHLARRKTGTVVGVNVGKSMPVPIEEADADYRSTVRRLAQAASYLVLNVSSPNTQGLRALQEPDRLRSLVAAVRTELDALGIEKPLLVKVDPDLPDEQLAAIVDLAVEVELAGIVAVNTTTNRALLTDRQAHAAPFEGGGVSGPPLRARATEVLRLIRRIAADRLVVISVGGIETADDVWERILAGATLVQVYTALVYAGPGWARRVNRELARKVRAAGRTSIQDFVGTAARDPGLTPHGHRAELPTSS